MLFFHGHSVNLNQELPNLILQTAHKINDWPFFNAISFFKLNLKQKPINDVGGR
jgi:hypothetical protein